MFDFDGMLVDSMPTFVNAVLRVLDETMYPMMRILLRSLHPWGLLEQQNTLLIWV